MKRISLIAGIAVYLIIVAVQVRQAVGANDGHFIYPIDDTYIHMAIAKNFAKYGVWGVTPYLFSSTSSSPLYTLLLSFGYLLLGPAEWVPLILNLLSGIALLFLLWRMAMKQDLNPGVFFCLAVATIVLTPLPALAISGMEHTTQLLIDLALLYYATTLITGEHNSNKRFYLVLLLSFLCTAVRYEGIFLVGLLSFFFVLRKNFKYAAALLFAGVLPVVLYGIVSLKQGACFLPNSVLLKGQTPSLGLRGLVKLGTEWLVQLFAAPHLLVVFFVSAAYCIYLNRRGKFNFQSPASIWSLTLFALCILHLAFARTGWFFRYEAYLMVLLFGLCIWVLKENPFVFLWKKPVLAVLTAVATLPLLYPLLRRSKDALAITVPATQDIYRQQYQMARFISQSYKNPLLAANDIGAICFYNDVRLLDLFGLGSNEVVALKRRGVYTKEALHQVALAKGTEVVMMYDSWFKGQIPDQWQKAGTWTLPYTVVVGDSTVSIYATELGDLDRLKKQLLAFRPQLPALIKQEGTYLMAADSVTR